MIFRARESSRDVFLSSSQVQHGAVVSGAQWETHHE
jgi:hypothetical protein